MTESAAPNPRRQGEIAIIAKTWRDAAFKQTLVTNPKAAIEQELGFQYPEDVTVQMVEALPNVRYIRLPEKPEYANSTSLEELTVSLAAGESTAMAQLIAKVWKDDLLKQALLSSPKAVLSQEFGTLMHAQVSVQVFPENAQSLVFILPIKPDVAVELSDEELEAVSGGVTPVAAIAFPFVGGSITAVGSVAVASIAGGAATYPYSNPPW